MKYIVLCFDNYGEDGWIVFWYGTSKREAEQQYKQCCKEHRYVRLDRVELIKEQTDRDHI